MGSNYDVVTIGSATVDHFADTDSELIRIATRSHHEELIAFPLGTKMLINELKTTVGGGGTNTAVSFAHLGLRTAYLGKVGADAAGDMVIDVLQKEKIDFLGPRGGQTGFSVILNSIEDDRSILAYKGANDELSLQEIPELNTRWIYLSSMLGESWDSVVETIRKGRFKVAFNPSNYQAELGYQTLMPLIEKVEILVMNREEACKFLGLDYREEKPIQELLAQLFELPPNVVVITDGSAGAFLYDGSTFYSAKPAESLNILETTGAGDAFASTLTACVISDLNYQDALHYAMTNAESVLQHKGAKEKLLTWKELEHLASITAREIKLVEKEGGA